MFKGLLRDLVLVLPVKEEKKTASGIILLDHMKDAKSNATRGKVIQVGPKADNVPVGSFVSYNEISAKDITHKGTDYHLVHEGDLFVIKDN